MLFRSLASCLLALSTLACLPKTSPAVKPKPPSAEVVAERSAACTAIWREELDRPAPYIDEAALHGCLNQFEAGGTVESIRANVQQAEEYKQRMARLEEERRRAEEAEKTKGKLRGRLRRAGTDIVDESGTRFLYVGASQLTILLKSPAERDAILDVLQARGFNGLRVFAGYLGWAQLTQTPEQARAGLHDLLAAAAQRGLYVQVTAITDSAQGYDVLAHLQHVIAITREHVNVILEVGNELYHGSQSAFVNNMSALCVAVKPLLEGYPNLWALGTAAEDHPVNGRYAADCGPVNTVHVSRGGDEDSMIRAMEGAALIMRVTGKPVINGEPIGAGEVLVVGSGARLNNPGFFGRMARRALSYSYGSNFHFEDGLFARLPWGPIQELAAQAFVNAYAGEPEDVPAPTLPTAGCETYNTPLEIVTCERGKYQGKMDDEQKVAFMMSAAATLNLKGIEGGPFGVLLKDGGTRCMSNGVAYSCDIVCSGQGAQQRQWDVLAAQETEQRPVWEEVDRAKGLVERPCEIWTGRRIR